MAFRLEISARFSAASAATFVMAVTLDVSAHGDIAATLSAYVFSG